MLPFSHRGELHFIDALFTATSAVCVTGLVVKSTGHFFTIWGQLVILLLIQLGALGILTFSTFIYLIVGKRISLNSRSIVLESLDLSEDVGSVVHGYSGLKDLFVRTALFTVIVESLGVLLLYTAFVKYYDSAHALYYALFHSVSAFCNAGFSTFDSSFVRWRGDVLLNVNVMLLIILGGIGYPVVMDVFGALRHRGKLSLHSRLVLTITPILILMGFLLFWLYSVDYYKSLHMDLKDSVLSSLFQSITARTAGFSTVDIGGLPSASLLLLMLLMFIGASPGSTGGGVKTTTIGVLFASMWGSIRGRNVPVFKGYSISHDTVFRAIAILFMFFVLVLLASFILLLVEPYSLRRVVFEVISALGTVGLSTGITPQLTSISKVVLLVLMFLGKIGPLTVAYNMFSERYINRVQYPEGRVVVG